MNKRLDIASRVLFGYALSDNEGNKAKTLAECRDEAAAVLVACDTFMNTHENVTTAIINAGYEPAEYAEQFMNILKELNNTQVEAQFFLKDMEKAWADGHEDGFWDARQTDATKPEPVAVVEKKIFFTEDDVQTAKKQGYVSGWTNGILSTSGLPDDADQMPLLGAEHGIANNPYSTKNVKETNND